MTNAVTATDLAQDGSGVDVTRSGRSMGPTTLSIHRRRP